MVEHKNTVYCFRCQNPFSLNIDAPISRREECPHCNADIHSCKMCVHYDNSSYNECREPVAQRVSDKEKSNFCEFYKICSEKNNREDIKKNAFDALTSLFKK